MYLNGGDILCYGDTFQRCNNIPTHGTSQLHLSHIIFPSNLYLLIWKVRTPNDITMTLFCDVTFYKGNPETSRKSIQNAYGFKRMFITNQEVAYPNSRSFQVLAK